MHSDISRSRTFLSPATNPIYAGISITAVFIDNAGTIILATKWPIIIRRSTFVRSTIARAASAVRVAELTGC